MSPTIGISFLQRGWRLPRRRPPRITRTLQRLHDFDLGVFQKVADAHVPGMEAVLPRLSRAADRSVLWLTIAGGLWAFGGRRARRAALRGTVSLAAASAIANLPAKFLFRRRRPSIKIVPEIRRLARIPASPSLPSGHSASASAFVTGTAQELPLRMASPLFPLAGGVAFSRIYTGVHYPGDVLAGIAIGSGIALASRAVWPLTHHVPARLSDLDSVPPRPSTAGEGVTFVLNPAAGGRLRGDRDHLLEERLPHARFISSEEMSTERGLLESAAARARVLGVAGGDGSVNAAASVALEAGVPLAVVPEGTFNHLARDLGIETAEDAVRAIEEGVCGGMDVGRVDGRVFLNSAAVGGYPEFVRTRERYESRLGKWPAMVIALARVLKDSRRVDLEIDGYPRKIWMAFIGNNRYEPKGFAPTRRARLDDGMFDVRIVQASERLARIRLILALLTGRLTKSPVYEQRTVRRLEMRSLRGPLRMAVDGEQFESVQPVTIEKAPQPLLVYRSHPEATTDRAERRRFSKRSGRRQPASPDA